ncbi:MAG: hypothetical protein ACR5K2_00120 [Wolbachia sp.]
MVGNESGEEPPLQNYSRHRGDFSEIYSGRSKLTAELTLDNGNEKENFLKNYYSKYRKAH